MKKRTCKNCNACKVLYLKFCHWFGKTNAYYCRMSGKILEADEPCKSYSRIKREHDISVQRLDEVKEDIEFLMSYFEEN